MFSGFFIFRIGAFFAILVTDKSSAHCLLGEMIKKMKESNILTEVKR